MSLTAVERQYRSGGLREVLHLAWPLVLTNGCWTIQIFIDRVFLAHHSQTAMAATLPSVLLFWAFLNLFFHTAGYVATFVAQYSGAGRPHRIGPAVGQALYFSIGSSVLFFALVPFVDQIVGLGGHSSELQAEEAIFLRCLCFGALPELIKATTFGFFNGLGQSRTVLAISITAMLVNAGLDYCWIGGHCGFPAWGIAGAGWATVAASSVSALLGFTLLLRRRYRLECATDRLWQFDLALFRRLLLFGLPNGLFIAIETAAFSAFILIVGRMGQAELAASNMAFTLNMVAFLPTIGIGQAVEVLVGRHLGENRSDLAANRTWIGFGLGWTFMVCFAAVIVFVPDIALAPFATTENQSELSITRVILRFIAFYSLFDSANVIFSNALRGAGDTKFVTKVMSALPWLGMVLPSALVLRYGYGLYWAWAAATFYICFLALIFFARFRHGAWKSMRVIEPEVVV
ncbi:MAG: MATE family efflux transporter [Gemmataceae bacterium]